MLTWVLFVFEFQFPIGIDSHRFIRALETPHVQEHINELKRIFTGRKVGVFFFFFFFGMMFFCFYTFFFSFISILYIDFM